MPFAWPSLDKPSLRRCSTPWSSSASNAWCAVCAMPSPSSADDSSRLPEGPFFKGSELQPACRRQAPTLRLGFEWALAPEELVSDILGNLPEVTANIRSSFRAQRGISPVFESNQKECL